MTRRARRQRPTRVPETHPSQRAAESSRRPFAASPARDRFYSSNSAISVTLLRSMSYSVEARVWPRPLGLPRKPRLTDFSESIGARSHEGSRCDLPASFDARCRRPLATASHGRTTQCYVRPSRRRSDKRWNHADPMLTRYAPGQNDMAYYNQTLKALHRRPEAKPDLRERLKSRRQRRQRRSSGANS